MYSQPGGREGGGGPSLDVDSFAIPAAFIRGLFGYEYGSSSLTLFPRLPEGVQRLSQKFVRRPRPHTLMGPPQTLMGPKP